MKTVIFDLDGTLALVDERRRRASLPGGKMDFSIMFDPKLIELDEPNIPVIETFKVFQEAGYHMVIFSGRSKATEAATLKWLDKHEVHADLIMMREDGDRMGDDHLKRDWMKRLFKVKSQILAIYDDRQMVVDMWRNEGYTCFQVAEADF